MIVSTDSAVQTLVTALSLQQASYKPAPNRISDLGNTTVHVNTSSLGGSGLLISRAGCAVEPYDPPDLAPPTFAPYDEKTANIFRYRKQLSVNLGSWFVQENWMNPSLFSCAAGPKAAELDVATGWGNPQSSRAVLEKHWDTWITEDDFAWLQRIGINTVRIPIGYWSLGALYCQGTPFEPVSSVYEQSWPRVLRAISWASKYNIGVLVDLHGAPGSQNGQSHSGTSDGKANLFDNDDNMQKTIDVLTYLTQQLVPISNMVGIQILNEPNNVMSLPDFYARVINVLRKISPEASKFPVYIHDGFNLERFADFVGGRKDFVVQDHHSYFVFTPSDSAKPAHEHTSSVKSAVLSALANASKQARHNLVVDEWSCALAPQSLSHLLDEAKQLAARKSFCSEQSSSYLRTTAGWSFWTYKTENCDTEDGWCFRKAVGRSLPSKFSSWDGAEDTNIGILATRENKDSIIAPEERHTHFKLTDMGTILARVGDLNSNVHQGSLTPAEVKAVLESNSDSGSPTSLPTELGLSGGGKSSGSEQPQEFEDTPESVSAKDGTSDGMTLNDLSPPSADDMMAPSMVPNSELVYQTVSMDLAEDSNLSTPVRRAIGPSRGIGSGSTVARLAARQKPAAEKKPGTTSSPSSGDKGYQDGYAVALAFGSFDGSRLGFATQYMEDSLSALLESKSVQPGKEDYYRKGFSRGLEVGERKVIEAIAKGVPVPPL